MMEDCSIRDSKAEKYPIRNATDFDSKNKKPGPNMVRDKIQDKLNKVRNMPNTMGKCLAN